MPSHGENLLEHATGGRYGLFVNGRFTEPVSQNAISSINPANAEPWYQITDATKSDIDDAVTAAKAALQNPQWANITQTARGKYLRKIGDLIAEHGERLAQIETLDNGKLIKEMRAQMSSLPETYYYYAGMADKVMGETIPVNKSDVFNFTLREPIGVVGIIVPWNSPLYLLSNALAPSLAIGNTVVIKPAENTSASALEFAALIREAGVPDGVVNIVTGLGETAGDALTRHPGLNKLAFTGGTDTGRKVATNAASNLIPCTMELGGKSPHVIFEDSDPDRAANGIVAGVFAAGGQTCIAGSRCFLQESIYDQFLQSLISKANEVIIGDPMADETQLGPLALESQMNKVLDYVNVGLSDGGIVKAGGKRSNQSYQNNGFYVEPTVFTDVSNDMRIAREEIFGPVVAVMPFKDEQELIEKANDTIYGLAAGIWTQDIDRAMRFAKQIDAGTVWVNTYRSASFMSPFGGFKQSGYGKHNGYEGIREFSRLKNVVVDYSGKTQDPFVMKLK